MFTRSHMAWGLAVSLLAVVLVSAEVPGRIRGAVFDPAGVPLPGAAVALRGTVNVSTETGPDGGFEFPNLPDAEYELTVTLSGFAPVVRRVRVAASDTANVSVTLPLQFLERISVTADRAGVRDPARMPMAVSAVSGAELARGQARTVEDIAGRVPSVTFSQHTGLAQVTIRGIGSNAVFTGSDPGTAVYLDGIYLARPAMALTEFVDVDRVEVLRGPQGTLYGRNAVGGAVHLVTRGPTEALDASVRLTAGTRERRRVEARVSGPIVAKRLSGSAAFLRGVSRGFVRDLSGADRWLGGEDVTAARGQLRAVVNDRAELLLSADVTHADPLPLIYAKVLAVKPGFTIDNPVDPLEIRTSSPTKGRQLQYGTSARLVMRLPRQITVTSLSAFRAIDYDVTVDTDITELNLTSSTVHEIQHQRSQEVTAAREGSRIRWVGGVFLFGDSDRQPTTIQTIPSRVESRTEARVLSRAGAAFGEAAVAVTPRVSVTSGLRYTRDRKTIANAAALYTLAAAPARLPGGFAYDDGLAHHAWTPRVGFDVRAGPQAVLYGSATRGFKSGGFNIASPERGRGYAPEWAWSYEAGLKTGAWGGRARMAAALFYTDYTDLQVQTILRPGVLDVSNAAAATIRGVEWEGAARLARRVHAGGHIAWLDARYDRYVAVGAGGATTDVAGHRLSNAPAWSGRFWVEVTAGVRRFGSLSLRADARRQSTVFFTAFNDAVQRQRPYGIVDASVELTPHGRRWSVLVYGRNLADARYVTGTFSSPIPAIGGRPGEPRRIGAELAVRR